VCLIVDLGSDTDSEGGDDGSVYEDNAEEASRTRRRRLNTTTEARVVIEDLNGQEIESEPVTALSVDQATANLLEIVRNRDLENYQAASAALYNAMLVENSLETRRNRVRQRE
jgi:hypothetical protein